MSASGVIDVLLLSNGHGEDTSGALLATALMRHGLQVEAMPLVGRGAAYRQAGVAVPRWLKDFSTGGLGYATLVGRLKELGQGQPVYLVSLLLRLWRHRRRYRLVIAVGDLIPVLAAWLTGRPRLVYLVAYSSHYEGRLQLPWPCGPLLRQRAVRTIWTRDALTAADLSQQLGRPVHFVGNPFLDPVIPAHGTDDRPAGGDGPCLLLLPGSRLPEAGRHLELMLQALMRLPAHPDLRLQAALVSGLDGHGLAQLDPGPGWRLEPATGGRPWQLQHRGGLTLELHWGAFAALLGGCDLVLSMTGTAAEQAVGLGLPVVQMLGEGAGSVFGDRFADAQRRLLGPGVCCAPGRGGSEAQIAGTARLLDDLLETLTDPHRRQDLQRQLDQLAMERIGPAGGTAAMAGAIMDTLARSAASGDG
ncbi:MAG: lipid-A-disaccharide synthase-related protein [Synechococcaceae cyanobacterium]